MATPSAQRLTACLARWEGRGHSQAELAQSTKLSQGYLSRVFSGLRRPKPETMAVILGALDPADAEEVLRAYILDEVPAGWDEHVRLDIVNPSPRLAEEPVRPRDDLELALAWLTAKARDSVHWRTHVLSLWRACNSIPVPTIRELSGLIDINDPNGRTDPSSGAPLPQ